MVQRLGTRGKRSGGMRCSKWVTGALDVSCQPESTEKGCVNNRELAEALDCLLLVACCLNEGAVK